MVLKCDQCGDTYLKRSGDIRISDRFLGPITVHSVEYYICGQCGDRLFPAETAKQIDKVRKEIFQNTLQFQPLDAFVSAAEAAGLLGITRQALHKHRRISSGFIFQTQFGGKTVYLKESVLRFKETGDGRFPLCETEKTVEYTKKTSTAVDLWTGVSEKTIAAQPRTLLGTTNLTPLFGSPYHA